MGPYHAPSAFPCTCLISSANLRGVVLAANNAITTLSPNLILPLCYELLVFFPSFDFHFEARI